jgi:hypothetical protein
LYHDWAAVRRQVMRLFPPSPLPREASDVVHRNQHVSYRISPSSK